MSYFGVAAGACGGSLLRFWLIELMKGLFGAGFFGTALANSLGCLIAGGVFALSDSFSSEVRLLVMTGFLGSLTTLSGLHIEVLSFLQEGRILAAFSHIGVAMVLGLVLCWLGYASVRYFS